MMFDNILHPQTKKLFDKVANNKKWPYSLVGGTALALHIGHRESTDLDFVTYQPITQKDIILLSKRGKENIILYQSDEQVDFLIDNVKVTLFTYYRPHRQELIPYKNITLWSVQDIATSKCYTIGRRNEFKDYVDLYFVLSQKHMTIERLINESEKRFGNVFSQKLFLKQLLLVEDCEKVSIKYLGSLKPSLKEIADRFHEQVKKFL